MDLWILGYVCTTESLQIVGLAWALDHYMTSCNKYFQKKPSSPSNKGVMTSPTSPEDGLSTMGCPEITLLST
jgi:hypothetical protein